MAIKKHFRISIITIALSVTAYVGAVYAGTPNPPVWAGSIVPTGEFIDLYTKWEGNAAFWFGNRMNDPDQIYADSAGTGFHWDGLPWHEIDEAQGATILHCFDGEMALHSRAQIRLEFSRITPSNATMATFVWEAKYDPAFFTGGKAFQIGDDGAPHGDQRKVEHNPVFTYGATDPGEPTWLIVPATRVYGSGDPLVGGNGNNTLLSSEEWTVRNVQPAIWAPSRNYSFSYARDHVTGTNTGTYNGETVSMFLVKPGQWYRYIYTLDWSSSPYRIWLWMEAEDTPRTLLLADENDSSQGFLLDFQNADSNGSDEFWFEFNNSSTINPVDFDIRVRNFFVVKDVLGKDL